MDEDAGGLAGVPRAVRQPLVEDHEDQVAEETEEEEELGDEQQVDVELLPEMPARERRHKNKTREKWWKGDQSKFINNNEWRFIDISTKLHQFVETIY